MGQVMRWGMAALALAASPVLAKPAPLPEGARYVALGSSFAAGPESDRQRRARRHAVAGAH
ncbi:hypothetical protein [Novosphingobium sp. THN1]|uniref:hypothetical protein n=1 Tax=Novosphingobium sp. THN1 TaxID=1016987 RepID=UPI0013C2DF50|nr:hypothetical protein [Novosphingobium sp. THN1]